MTFCDWLSVYQVHPEGKLPVVNNGCVWAVDSNGEIEWTTLKKFDHVGSFDTRVRIKCDGHMVAVDGNVGRFQRPDNLFGYSVLECLEIASDICAGFSLPRFTSSQLNLASAREDSYIPLGAVITRIDLTTNYFAGSAENAGRVAHYMAGQGGTRAMPKSYGTSGVSWNEGSRFWYAKLYDKSREMGKHADPRLIEWAKHYGILRHEISLKTRYLTQQGLRYPREWQTKEGFAMEKIVYGRFADVLTRNTVATVPYAEIRGRLGRIARDWMNGTDVMAGAESDRTKRRWRKELLPFGIDIKFPCDVSKLALRCEVIQLQEVPAPAWYWELQREARRAA